MKSIALLFVLLPLMAISQLTGRVVGITDGDTFTLLDSNKNQVKIRLHGIDAPEKGQPFSTQSKKYLSELLYLKQVSILSSGTDRYGRTLGIVKVGNTVINEQLLAAGMAWHFKKYDSRKDWARLEEKARSARVGLWVDKDPVAPWEWRKLKKKKREF